MTDKEIIQEGKYGLYIDWNLDGHFENITTSITELYKQLNRLKSKLKIAEQALQKMKEVKND